MQKPRHVAIILDGNRRFSRSSGLKPWQGHEKGAEKVKDIIRWAKKAGIRILSLYTFSTENFSRPKREVDYLMKLFIRKFEELKKSREIEKEGIKVRFAGDLGLFPAEVREAMNEVGEKTKDFSEMTVNFCMGYGAKQEILAAARAAAKGGPDGVIEDSIDNNLYISEPVDLLIRPGGEIRLSNFLLWQSAYAELFFLDVMWPEFSQNDFEAAISEFGARKRRYGK